MSKDIVIIMLSVMCMVFCVSAAVFAVNTRNLSARFLAVEQECAQVRELVAKHDDIMLTYQFFNEKWENGAYK